MKKFFRNFFRSHFVQISLARLASYYIKFVFYTTKWEKIGFKVPTFYVAHQKPFITTFWHERLFMLCYAWPFKKKPFHMLISYHADGKLISKTVGFFGIKTIFGSTGRGGVAALKESLSALKNGAIVGVTPDGPRGPRHSVAKGLLAMAKLAKCDIIPVSYMTTRGKTFQSWDQFFLPFPFGRGAFAWGKPIENPHLLEEEALEKKIKQHMLSLEKDLSARVLDAR